MLKAVLLIFNRVAAWESIAEARRGVWFILPVFLLPILLLTSAVEIYGLVNWGRQHEEFGRPSLVPLAAALKYGAIQLALSLAVVFAAAKVIQAVGESFHGRHTFNQAFTVVAYSLSPLFMLRLLDALPRMPTWVTWAVGIVLTASVLYQGLPIVMIPDPPHAFGLYFMSVLLLVVLTGLARFLMNYILQQQIMTAFLPASGMNFII